jgi:hypothetical protein
VKIFAAFVFPVFFLLISTLTLLCCRNVSSTGEISCVSGGLVLVVHPFGLAGETSAANIKLYRNTIDDAANYAMYRSANGSLCSQVVFSNSTTYDDYAVSAGKCCYQIKAVPINGAVIATSSVVVDTVIEKSSGLNVYANSSGQVTLTENIRLQTD